MLNNKQNDNNTEDNKITSKYDTVKYDTASIIKRWRTQWLQKAWHKMHQPWLDPSQGLMAHNRSRTGEILGDYSPLRMTKRKFASAAVGSLMLLSSMAPVLQAETITVGVNSIGTAGDGNCDLAEAIQVANTDTATADCTIAAPVGGADTIDFNTSPDTITLVAADVIANPNGNGDNGLPLITSAITINGGTGGITITRSGGTAFRILEVDGARGQWR